MRETICLYLSILLLLTTCNGDKHSSGDELHPLHEAPLVVALNTEEGYSINPLTRDSIQPIINSSGDTLITGVPVPARGKVIDPNSVSKPRVIPAGKPRVVPIPLKVHKIQESLTVIPVDKGSLKTFTPGIDTSSFVLVNLSGDTIPTGVPIPTQGRVVPCKQPQPVKALPPRIRRNASVSIKYLDEDQGMNSSNVLSILEDSHGNLWFGTYLGGVSMYNGETFTHFTSKEGLSGDRIYSILEDSHGNLWFGTFHGGVSMYDGETFTYFTPREGLSNKTVQSILEDSNGNLWFGTRGGGVSMFNGETFTHVTQKEGLCNNNVRSILEDSHRNIWFATGGGVSMYKSGTFTHFTQREGLSNNSVRSILEDCHGNIWFGTAGGVSMYDGETFTHFTEKEGLSNNNVWSILEDSRGNLWFCTEHGASMYKGETFTHITEKDGLSNNYVSSVLEDSHGNIWFATGGGVSIYYGETFTHFTQEDGLIGNRINSLLEDSHGNIWFGAGDRGVNMYNGGTITHFTPNEGLIGWVVYSILEDSHGNIWFSSYGNGVCMYNGETFTHFTQKEGLSNNVVLCIQKDSHGNLWFGTVGGGVSMYKSGTFTHFTQKEGLSSNVVFCILEDRHGSLWFGTGRGVSMYNGKTFTHFTQKEGLSSNGVSSIQEDRHGNLWFGTGRGVSMYNGKTFMHFTEEQGLSNNDVKSILEDDNNNIWVGTFKGLNRIVFGPESVSNTKKGLSAKNPVVHSFSLQDGPKSMEFIINAAFLDSKNRIWWGSSKCLTMLDISNLRIPTEPPVMQLNRLEIDGQFVDYRRLVDEMDAKKMEFSGVARFKNYPLKLELPYKHNHLTFHFSAIDWSAPHKIRYSYLMDGLNEKWSVPKAEASADYQNLPYGTHTFKVRAIGAAQKWSEPFEYTFYISPPWWYTWWARVVYVIIGILLIIMIVRLRTANLKQRQKELEQKIEERTAEIQDKNEELSQQKEELKTINEVLEDQKEKLMQQKDELQVQKGELQHQKEELQVTLENLKTTQSQLVQSEKMASIGQLVAGIAHEINNPITFISAGVDSLNTNLEEVRQVLDIYHKITLDNVEEKLIEIEKQKEEIEYNEAINEINILIDSVRTGSERTAEIVKGLRTFSRLDEDVLKFADINEGLDSTLILLRSKYKERIEIEKQYRDIPEIECFPGQLNQVFMNLLLNAIDAIEDKGTITIGTSKADGSIQVSIKDTGRGIPEDIQSKIFDPFFTTKDVGKGTGLGLSICHSIIEKHKGKIEVQSETGKGSEFMILLPVKQSKR
jgi:signal transduction histidine kinase/ligand-binding sensor domain-containing protein